MCVDRTREMLLKFDLDPEIERGKHEVNSGAVRLLAPRPIREGIEEM